jgi:hypothetical protein
MPWEDPIVEEVRKARDAYAKRFTYDLDAIYHDLHDLVEERQFVSHVQEKALGIVHDHQYERPHKCSEGIRQYVYGSNESYPHCD